MAADSTEHSKERLLRRVSELEVTTREQQQQISALVDDLRQAEKKASETQKTLKDSAHAAQEAQTEAQLEIRKLRERLQTRESVPRTSSSIYSSARSDGVLAHPVADNSELARVQGLLELETLARAQAEAEAYDLEARLNDLQRAFSRRYPSIDGDNHEPVDEGGGGLKELRDQVAHLQNRLAQAEATTDAHLRGQESEARRKTILLEQQVLALECEVQRLSLQREREDGNKALCNLYEVGVAGSPSSEAEQLLQLKTVKDELTAEVDSLKAANAALTTQLHAKAEELIKKDLENAAREDQILRAEGTEKTTLEQMAEELTLIRKEHVQTQLASGKSESKAERALVEVTGERDALRKTCAQLSKQIVALENVIQQRDEAVIQLKGSTNMVQTLRSQLAEAADVIVKLRAAQQNQVKSSDLQTESPQQVIGEELLKSRQECESLRMELAKRDHDAARLVEEFFQSHNEFANDVSQFLPNLKKLEKSLHKELESFAYDMGARSLELPSFPTGALGFQIEPELRMGKASVSNLEFHLDKASESVGSLDKMFKPFPEYPTTPPKKMVHETVPLETIFIASTNPSADIEGELRGGRGALQPNPTCGVEVPNAQQPEVVRMLPSNSSFLVSSDDLANVAQAPLKTHELNEEFNLLEFSNADSDQSMHSENSVAPPPCSPVLSPTSTYPGSPRVGTFDLPNQNAVSESLAEASPEPAGKLLDPGAETAGSDDQKGGVAELTHRQVQSGEELGKFEAARPPQRMASGGERGGGGSGEEEVGTKQGDPGEQGILPRFSKWAPTHDQHIDKLLSQGFAIDPNGDPLHVSPDGGHRPFKPVKEILGSRPSRGCLSPAGGRQRDPESAKSQSSMRFCDAESEDGTKKSQKRISFVGENTGEAVGPQNVLCLLDPKDHEVRGTPGAMFRPGGPGALRTSSLAVDMQDQAETADAADDEQVRVNTEINGGSLYSFC